MSSCICILQITHSHAEKPEIEIDGTVFKSLSDARQRELAYPSTDKIIANPGKNGLAPVVLRPPVEHAPPVNEIVPLIEKIIAEIPAPASVAVSTSLEMPATAEPPKTAPKAGAVSTPPAMPIVTYTPAPVKRDTKKTIEVDPKPLIAAKVQPVILKPDDESAPVVTAFPVKTRMIEQGDLNPSASQITPAAKTSAPLIQDEKMNAAIAESMSAPATKGTDWRQDNPEVLYADIPIPAQRPQKQKASEEFVREARKTLVDTYTIKNQDGDAMPAVAQKNVTKENLPAPRMSVDDIANDPLASQIVDMSPEELAKALNDIVPASGLTRRDLVTVSKPRIVRTEGEWIRKSKKAKIEPVATHTNVPGLPKVAPEVISGDIEVYFKPGKSTIDQDEKNKLDRVINATLKSASGQRIQVVAFASAPDGKETTARRAALSRAIAIRSDLIARGIDATRIDVRALGLNPDKSAIQDKVDIILVPEGKT